MRQRFGQRRRASGDDSANDKQKAAVHARARSARPASLQAGVEYYCVTNSHKSPLPGGFPRFYRPDCASRRTNSHAAFCVL